MSLEQRIRDVLLIEKDKKEVKVRKISPGRFEGEQAPRVLHGAPRGHYLRGATGPLYSASVTSFNHVMAPRWILNCVPAVVGVDPCQCATPGGT